MSTLCLDLGATYIKVGQFDDEGSMLESVRLLFPAFIEETGPRREVDTAKILEAVVAAFSLLRGSIGRTTQVMVSCQMQGFVFVDRETLRPLSHFISWQDGRCLNYQETLDRLVDEELRLRIGNDWRPGHAATTWYALRQEGQLPAGVVPLSVGDFVIASLARALPAMHATNAAGFGCWNVAGASWEGDVLRRLGLEDVSLPDATSVIVPQGESKYGTFHSCVGDQQAALLGAGIGPSNLSVNIATGSQVSCLTATPQTSMQYQTRPFFGGAYLRTITHLPAGRAVGFLLKALGAEVDGIVLKPNFESDLRVNLNFFPSALGSHGAIENVREGNFTKEDVLYAAFATMSDNYRDAAEKLDPRREKREIIGSGGMLSKSGILRGMVAEKLGRKLIESRSAEDALEGLFKLSKPIY